MALGLVLLCVTRLVLVASLADVFYYGEELAKGAAAKAMRDGLGLPHHLLAYHAYEGGGFVFSHLDALAFTLVGESLLALKLVALSWSCAMLVAGWWAARESFGGHAAGAFALLFALAPASIQKTSLLALGIHYEAGLFLLLGLGLGCRILVDGCGSPRRWFALGAVLGFGTYFSYQTVLFVAYLGLLLLVFARRRLFGRAGLAAVLGGLTGALPWFVMAALVGGEVFDIHGAGLFEGGAELVRRHARMLASLFAGRGVVEQVALGAALAAAPLGAVSVARMAPERRRRRAMLVLAGYVLFFLGVYALSDFAVGPVYHHFRLNRLSPVWLLGTLALAAAIGEGLERGPGRTRALGLAALALVALLGLLGTWRSAGAGVSGSWLSHLRLLAHTPGFGYASYLPRLEDKLGETPIERMRLALRFDDPHPDRLLADVGGSMLADEVNSAQAAEDLARELAGERWAEVLRGSAAMWSRMHGLDSAQRWGALQGLPAPLADVLAEAQGRFGESFRVTRAGLQQEIDTALALGVSRPWLVGLGWRTWDVLGHAGPEGLAAGSPPAFALDHEAARAFLESQPAGAREALLEGWERARRERMLP